MSAIYEKLQFTNVIDASIEDKESLGIDRVHKSGDFQTIFFKEVNKFDEKTLKEIAKIHHNLWNYKKVLFLYVTSKTEIKIYNCSHRPFNYQDKNININKELKKIELASSNINKIDTLFEIFSAPAIDSGSIWTRDSNYLKQLKLNKRIDKFLVDSLVQTAKELEKQGLDLDVVHSLIMRSLFIMYLEDKGATPKEFYEKEKQNAHSYFDLLDDKEATYYFFEKIRDNFNGNVFPVTQRERESVNVSHLELIKRCFTNGDIKGETLFSDWRIFKFDIIQIELLSEIYEKFLGELQQKKTGSYYTPPALVELILNEVLPIKNGEKAYNLKILDPTCGSGIFLVEAYKRIVIRWQNANPKKVLDFKTLKKIMLNSIYGIELNSKSIKVASFSLYLSLLDFLNPKNLWYLDDEKFPYLINDEADENIVKQGDNLFRADTIKDNKKFKKQYDLIIGNPPYGKGKIPNNIKAYCTKYNFSQEFVIPFIHKSTLLAPKGKIALLATTKLLTNTSGTSQKFREWLFNENYVERIYNLSILRKTPKNFGGSLFSSATVPASIFFFRKKAPKKKSKTIEYWAPKTYIKNHIAEGVVIDSSDIKYLPRKECQKPNTKIWKIAQWGTLNDFNILDEFLTQEKNFLDYLDDNGIDTSNRGVGFQPLGKSKSSIKESRLISELDFIGAKNINRYYTDKSLAGSINDVINSPVAKEVYSQYYKTDILNIPKIDAFRRLGNTITFKAPHVLIKEGFSKNRFCATYLDYNCTFTSTILGLHSDDSDILKLITSYLNSKFSIYFLFLTSSSWGIEREKVKPNELYLLPYINKNINIKKIVKIYNEIELSIKNSVPLISDISIYESKIDKIIAESFNLSIEEQIFIDDTIKYTIDLFHKGDKSIAIKPLETKESKLYAIKLCEKINEVLEDSDIKLIAKVYKPSYYNPLSLIRFQFVDKNNNSKIEVVSIDNEFDNSLAKLNQFTLDEYSKSIYMQKNITYYDDDLIYIIKPNQKRFWTQSQAIENAQSITLEIMGMSNE